jgi:hypothetical protein
VETRAELSSALTEAHARAAATVIEARLPEGGALATAWLVAARVGEALAAARLTSGSR